jgi:F1F0 ATPase subunit 2
MNEVIFIGLSLLAGIGLGFIFFGGLWWTVKIATNSKNPALWFLGSLALRLTLVLAGFYSIGVGDLVRLLSCFAGFFIARYLVIHLTKAYDLRNQKGETTHEA